MVDKVWRIINEPWFGLVVGILLAVVGIILAIVLYRRAKPVARLRHAIGHASLIGDAPEALRDGLEVRFNGSVVPRVTRTSYGLWNDGNVTIRGHDIVATDPIRLEFPSDVKILRATIEQTTRAVTDPTVHITDTVVEIGFDFLDRGDGFRAQIIHSGTDKAIVPRGTVRGIPQGLTDITSPSDRTIRVLRVIASAILLPLIAIMGYIVFKGAIYLTGQPLYKSIIALFMLSVPAYVSYRGYKFGEKVRSPHNPIRGVPSSVTDDPILLRNDFELR